MEELIQLSGQYPYLMCSNERKTLLTSIEREQLSENDQLFLDFTSGIPALRYNHREVNVSNSERALIEVLRAISDKIS